MPLASVFKNFGIESVCPMPFNLLLHPTHPFPPPCSLPWSPTWILCTDQEPLPLQCASSKTLRFQKKSKIFFFYDKYPIVSIRYFFGGVFQGLLKFSALKGVVGQRYNVKWQHGQHVCIYVHHKTLVLSSCYIQHMFATCMSTCYFLEVYQNTSIFTLLLLEV